MSLREYFTGNPVDFEKRCRQRLYWSTALVFMGALAVLAAFLGEGWIAALVEKGVLVGGAFTGGGAFTDGGFLAGGVSPIGGSSFAGGSLAQYYGPLGAALMAAGITLRFRVRRMMRDPERRRQWQIAENDERNRLLGLRCWAYSGYAMFVLLYVAILIGGFINPAVASALLAVMGVYGVLLLLFRTLLQRWM